MSCLNQLLTILCIIANLKVSLLSSRYVQFNLFNIADTVECIEKLLHKNLAPFLCTFFIFWMLLSVWGDQTTQACSFLTYASFPYTWWLLFQVTIYYKYSQHENSKTIFHQCKFLKYLECGTCWIITSLRNCDWIYGNHSKSHIGSYEIIDF